MSIIMFNYEELTLVKILFIGDAGVGKSQIISRFADQTFSEEYKYSIGVDFKIRSIETEQNWPMTMQIWDSAGLERFKNIRINIIYNSTRISYYRGKNWVVLVYDVSSRESFENIDTFIKEEQDYTTRKNIKFIWGNKIDMNKKRVVSTEEGLKAAEKHNAYFIETSAKDGINVDILFNFMAWILKNDPELNYAY